MADFNAGDEIKAVKGKTKIEGELVGPGLAVKDTDWRVDALLGRGFAVTVTKAAVVVPTEPGYYLDREGDVTGLAQGGSLSPHYAPYIRLEPVLDTVARAANWLQHDLDLPHTADALRAEFGTAE